MALNVDTASLDIVLRQVADKAVGYHVWGDDSTHGRPGFVTLRYGKGHWSSGTVHGQPIWLWDSEDHTLIDIVLPEAWVQ